MQHVKYVYQWCVAHGIGSFLCQMACFCLEMPLRNAPHHQKRWGWLCKRSSILPLSPMLSLGENRSLALYWSKQQMGLSLVWCLLPFSSQEQAFSGKGAGLYEDCSDPCFLGMEQVELWTFQMSAVPSAMTKFGTLSPSSLSYCCSSPWKTLSTWCPVWVNWLRSP